MTDPDKDRVPADHFARYGVANVYGNEVTLINLYTFRGEWQQNKEVFLYDKCIRRTFMLACHMSLNA